VASTLRLRLVSYNGPRLTQRAQAASIAGLNETMEACVAEAKMNHRGWRNRTGRAERSIKVLRRASPFGSGCAGGSWGSFDCPYFIYLERRYGTLRGAADVVYPTLGRRVLTNFQRLAVGG
jgi:hypothetical protein